MQEKISLSSFNCRGLGDGKKRRAVFQWLRKYHNGIILLQETHSTIASESTWLREWGGKIVFNHGTSNSKGVAILFSKNIDIKLNECISDDSGRLLIVDIETDDWHMVLANVYAPTKDHEDEQLLLLESIREQFLNFIDRNLVIAGDFNVCLDPNMDKRGGLKIPKSKYAESLESLMEELNIGDIWRILNPNVKRFTWRSNTRKGIVQSRLDFWLASIHMMYDIFVTDIKPGIKSDHSIITLSFSVPGTSQRGNGFWKFNSSLLKEPEYIQCVKQCIHNCKQKYLHTPDKSLVWDTIKCEIRTVTISFASYKSKHIKKTETKLYQKLQKFESCISAGEVYDVEEYDVVKREFEEIQTNKAHGIMVRSRANLIENDERCTKYFLSLERRNHNVKHIKSLITENERTITDPGAILQEQMKYYQNLYSAGANILDHDVDECPFFNGLNQLDINDKILCDSHITIEELGKNLKQLPNNKSPGCDGLTTEFYKFFWRDICDPLYQSYLYSFESGKLSQDQRRSVINLIPKPNKDVRMLKNWRPLSLLNTDYKILAKTLASRLQLVITKLVKPDQTGCIRGRYIGENIRTILDLIEYTTLNNIPGYMVMIDFEKAFDSVSWPYLFSTLHKYNFGNFFIKWIKLLYNEPMLCVTNNGFASSFFPMGRGIRQGCPISALLFLLVAETMADNIRSNDNVSGIKVSDVKIVISQYADDTTLFLKDESSIKSLFQILEHFGKCAGLKINKTKTEILSLGQGERHEKVCGVHCKTEPVKCLGVWIGKNIDEIIELNFKEKVAKLKNILNIWRQRKLTYKGKVVVINSLALSQLLYVSTVLFVPQTIIDDVNDVIFKFLWPKKVHVKKPVIIQGINEGGLKMPDFASKIKAGKIAWVKRLVQGGNNAILAREILKIPMPWHEFCGLNFNTALLPSKTPPFYKQLLQYWFNFYSFPPTKVEEIRSQPLWFNQYITVDNVPLYLSNAYNNGLRYFNDILDDFGNILSLEILQEKFDINWDTMLYNSFYSAIPKSWKKAVRNTTNARGDGTIYVRINGIKRNIENVNSKDIYWEIVRKMKEKPTACIKWESLYDLINFDWEYIFSLPYKMVRETSIQSLQFQILHRFYPCNSTLNRWYENHPCKCIHCDSEDTLEHYFYKCKHTQSFWHELIQWWYNVSGTSIKFSMLDVLFGLPNPNDDMFLDSLNYCILFGKKFISQQKRNDKRCIFGAYLMQLRNRLEYEKVICAQNGKLEHFENKWANILYPH